MFIHWQAHLTKGLALLSVTAKGTEGGQVCDHSWAFENVPNAVLRAGLVRQKAHKKKHLCIHLEGLSSHWESKSLDKE